MPDLRKLLAIKIKTARRAAGMTQEQLAETASTSVEFVSRTERGLNTPRPENLVALFNALGLDLSMLFESIPNLPKRPIARLELEARAVHFVRRLDDRALGAVVPLMLVLQERSAPKKEE
jgi:transcriptional regulator with XRE-family HTH domain